MNFLCVRDVRLMPDKLNTACCSGNLDQLKQLITCENVNQTDFLGYSVLEILIVNDHHNCVEWLRKYYKPEFTYLDYHHYRLFKFLDHGLNPNDKRFTSPLIYEWFNDTNALRKLLDCGADPNIPYHDIDVRFDSVLDYAFTHSRKNRASACLVMEAGGKLDRIQDKSIIPKWAAEYEAKLDKKRFRCSKSSVALWFVLIKSRVPKDLIRQIIRDKIKLKWLLF